MKNKIEEEMILDQCRAMARMKHQGIVPKTRSLTMRSWQHTGRKYGQPTWHSNLCRNIIIVTTWQRRPTRHGRTTALES